MKELNLAIITSRGRPDGLTRTVIDGVSSLNKEADYKINLKTSYEHSKFRRFFNKNTCLSHDVFVDFAKKADLIILAWGKDNTDITLAEKIGAWNKTFYVDGSELGRNRRFDQKIMEEVSNGSYKDGGSINFELLNKCAGYFRREPPYVTGIIPLPFGIESRYIKYKKGIKKDIDFVCIFGQEDYPTLRREVRLALEEFCKVNNFSYRTMQTRLPFLSPQGSIAQKRFRSLLARAKVGVSVSGGGYDTFRFWEILANNCILLADIIGIYPKDSGELKYKRIWQFSDVADFKLQLEAVGSYLKNEYNIKNMNGEYSQILERHSSKSRVLSILDVAIKKGLI